MLGLMRVSGGVKNLEDPRLLRLSQLPSRPPSRPALTSRCRAPSRGNLTTRVRDASPQQGPQRPSRNSFVVSGITAYQMAHRMAEVQPGQVTETASAKGRLNRRSLRAWLVGRPDERARALSWNASRAARPSRWSHGRSWSWWQTSSAASRNEGRRRRPRAPCRSSPSFPRSCIATRPAHDSILQTGTWRPCASRNPCDGSFANETFARPVWARGRLHWPLGPLRAVHGGLSRARCGARAA